MIACINIMLIIYLLYCNRHSIVLTIQNVCRLDFLQVQRGRCGKTLLDREKRLLSFQKKHSVHGDYVSGDVAITGDNSSLHWGLFNRKTSFKSNLKLIESI